MRPADDDPFPGSGPDAVLDVQGFPLRRAVYEQFLAFDLLHELKAFRGRSLVVQLSATPRRRPDLQRLVAALASLGGASTLEVVVDPQAGLFAQPRYRSHAGRKEDTQRGMSDRIISATLAWCGGSELGAHGGEERRRA